MNIYEQLQGVKSDLQSRGARPESIKVIDSMIRAAFSGPNALMSTVLMNSFP